MAGKLDFDDCGLRVSRHWPIERGEVFWRIDVKQETPKGPRQLGVDVIDEAFRDDAELAKALGALNANLDRWPANTTTITLEMARNHAGVSA